MYDTHTIYYYVVVVVFDLAGTVVRPGEGDTLRKMSEAFDILEDDLCRTERGNEGGRGRGRGREAVRMSLPARFMDR